MQEKPKAVILLSGGLDSATVLAMAMAEGYECCCLSFAYGQRQQVELERAKANVARRGIKNHLILRLDLDAIGGSALTTDAAVPKGRSQAEMDGSIPITYVPGRNTIFLSYAMAWAEVLGAGDVFIGVNVMDYSGYPDCRPEFLEAFEKMANLATRTGVEGETRFRVHAPLLRLTKREIIEKGFELGVDYGLTHSCYDPSPEGKACGRCDSCILRRKGFGDAGVPDHPPRDAGAAHPASHPLPGVVRGAAALRGGPRRRRRRHRGPSHPPQRFQARSDQQQRAHLQLPPRCAHVPSRGTAAGLRVPMTPLGKARPRGYLLMEVAIGGAMCAVIIAGIMLVVSVEESLKDKAKTLIKTSIIVMVVVLVSYTFVSTILSAAGS